MPHSPTPHNHHHHEQNIQHAINHHLRDNQRQSRNQEKAQGHRRHDRSNHEAKSEALHPEVLEEVEPFHERYAQDEPDVSPPTRSDNRQRHDNHKTRSHSLPPSTEVRNRLGANFPFPKGDTFPRVQRGNSQYDDHEEDAVVSTDHSQGRDTYPDRDRDQLPEKRHSGGGSDRSNRGERSPSRSNPPAQEVFFGDQSLQEENYQPDQYLGDGYGGKKKVSYAVDSIGRNNTAEHNDDRLQYGQNRPKSDFTEGDEDGPNPKSRHPRSSSPDRNQHDLLSSTPLLVNSVDSQGSFLCTSSQEDGSMNKSNNNNANGLQLHYYSQDSMMSGAGSGRPACNNYSRDVLPLPIEIPEGVADIQAFRRYLSVRRGALSTARNSFEKANQTSPSYESLGGRRAGRASLGLTPSRVQLGHEASRRTASLSHAIMTLALLSASICQLRFLITYSHAHSFPVLNYFLIFTSIILEEQSFILVLVLSQISAGIGYVMISRCNYDDEKTESIHNYLIFALFIVAVSNVILAAFAFDGHICEERHLRLNNPTYDQFGQQPQGQQNQGQGRAAGDSNTNLRYNALE